MPSLGSPALSPAPQPVPHDARFLLAQVEAELRNRLPAFGVPASVALTEKTIRSLLAEIEIKAHADEAPLKTTPCRLDGVEVATAYSFERKLGGVATGIHDGMVVLSPAWERHLTPWLCHRLQDLIGFELATLRIPGVKMPPAAPDRFKLRNRSLTAVMRADRAQEVMRLGDSFERLLEGTIPNTRRSLKRCLDDAAEENVHFSFVAEALAPDPTALRQLAAKNLSGVKSFQTVASAAQFVAAQARPFHTMLTHPDGHAMSACGGFIEGDLGLVAYQLAHRADRDSSPGVTLRAFLIRALIEQGVRYLAFVGNGAGLLTHSCEAVTAAELLMMRNTRSARLKYWACSMLQPHSRIAQIGVLPRQAKTA